MRESTLVDIGFELITGLSSYFPKAALGSSNKSWEYVFLRFNNSFHLRLCRWRNDQMPAYLVLYKDTKFIFEMDLSMVVQDNSGITWYLKQNIQNDKSKRAIKSMLGEPTEMPKTYRNSMLNNKKLANSGKDTPKNGFKLSFGDDANYTIKRLATLCEKVISAHGGRSVKVNRKSSSDAPNDDVNTRQMRATSIRRGQGKFRANLLEAYKYKCAISGWCPEAVLDACHIEAHGISGNNKTSNGILLRADLHNLFDTNLLRINPETFVVEIDVLLKGTNYWDLNGKKLKSDFKPSKEFLSKRY